MLRNLRIVTVVGLAACLLASSHAFAQRGGGSPGGFGGGPPGGFSGRGGRGGTLGELMNPDTQGELGLTPEQLQQIQQVTEDMRSSGQQMGDIFQRMREAQSDEDREKIRDEMRQRFEEMQKKADEQVKKIISEDQYKRISQIQLHREGPRALSRNEDLAKEIGLSDEQKQQIEKLNEERDNARRSLGFGASEEDRNKFQAEWDQKFLSVLSPEQQKKWTERLGPAPIGGSGFGGPRSLGAGPAQPRIAMFETAPDGAEVKASFGNSDGKLIFSFQYAPWERVLKMFAEQSKLSLNLNAIPPGTFSYFDNNEYTATEAVDLLNGYLQPKGYSLIQHDNFLTTVNLDAPISPPLIPKVTPEQLDSRGTNELLTVIFPVEGDVDRIAREIDSIKGPWGKVVGLQAASAVSVQDSGGNLRRIRDLLDSFKPKESPTSTSYKAYTLKHVPIGEAEIIIRSILNVPAPSSSGDSRRDFRSSSSSSAPSAQLTANPSTNQLLVIATKADHERIDQALKDIDVEERSGIAGQFGMNSAVQMKVIPLSKMDPLSAVMTLRPMFTKDGDNAPTIEADVLNRQLMVRGSSEQMLQIDILLKSLGEDGTGRRESSNSVIRSIPLSGRDPEELIPLIEQLWRAGSPAPIRVISPSDRGAIQGIRSPGGPWQQDQVPNVEEPPVRDQPNSTGHPLKDDHENPDAPRADAEEMVSGQFVAAQTSPGTSETNTEQPPVVITVIGDDLVISSGNPENLDQLEDLLERTMSVIPPRTSWVVFTLQSADATECATQLETLIPSSSVSMSSTGTGLMGAVNSMTSDLMSMSGISSVGMLRIVPDTRLNALFVSGTPSQVRQVEEMLKILDASNWPDSDRNKVTRVISVQYAQARDVYEMLRETYKPFLETQNQGQQGNPLAAFMGGRGGGGSREQNAPPPAQLAISVNDDTNDLVVWCDASLFSQIEETVKTIDERTRAMKPTVQVVTLQNTSSTVMQQALGTLLPRVNVSTTGSRSSRSSSSSSSQPSAPPSPFGQPGGGGGPTPEQIQQFRERMMQQGGGGAPSPFGGGFRGFGSGGPGGGGFPGGGSFPFGGRGGDSGRGGSSGRGGR